MNSKFFSLFLVTILGFSAFSVSSNGINTYQNAEYSINLVEDLTISSGFGQKIGNAYKITLDEQLEVSNHEKYQKLVSATKQLTDRHAIMDRVVPNTRLRIAQDDDLGDQSNQVSMTEFIEIITDLFYDGGAKTPSTPSIPLAFATNGNSDSLQLLQVDEIHGKELETAYSDTGTPWAISNNQKGSSQIFLDYTQNHIQFDTQYNTILPELDFTQTVIVISTPAAIYIILFSEGLVPAIRTPKIPQSAGFYFLFTFFVVTSFSTPFATGNGMWGSAFGNMDNSTNTNSTQIENPDSVQITNTTQINDVEIQFQNSTVTQTDNVADGPKHYSISISEGLIIGDGSPTGTQIQNEPIFEELSGDVEISESISFSDELGKEETITGNIIISESLSISDQLGVQADIIPSGEIRLNEAISFNEEVESTFGIGLVKISEFISLEDGISTEFYRPLNVIVDVEESIEFSSQISINGVAEIQIYEVLSISEIITIYTPNIRIQEFLEIFDVAETQFIEIPLNEIPVTSITPENETLLLNGTSYFETNQDIGESVNQFTISAWVKPQFNVGTPQMVAVSKDLTFQIVINNLVEPQHTPIFAIYDGMTWHEVIGNMQLQEGKWHHIAGVLDNSEITMFVDGIQQEAVLIPELYLVDEEGWLTETEMGISVSESGIVIGADYDLHTDKTTSKFSGGISGVLIHSKALDAEFIKQVLQDSAPYSATNVVLSETIQISDVQGLAGSGTVNINEAISFPEMIDTGMIILPRILTEKIDLIGLNGTYTDSIIALNGTEFVTVEDTISSDINTMSISSWIKPEFNTLSTSKERAIPQYTITSKENSFNLYVRNIAEPSRTVGFSVFDGIKWHELSGQRVLDDKWHHVMAFVNGSNIALYVDGSLQDEQTIQNEFSIGKNGQYSIKDSQISVSDSEIVIGAYVSTFREEIKTSAKFVGKIASVDVYTDVLNDEQISYKYETELLQVYKTVSLYESIQIGDQTNLLYELIRESESYKTDLDETIVLKDSILTGLLNNTIYIEERLTIQENISIADTVVNTFNVNLDENLSVDDNVIALNPFAPFVNPEIQMVKAGFLITENPKFELEYYSEDDAVKIDHQQIVNATSIANRLQEELASTPSELLATGDVDEITTAIQVIETRKAISQLEDQVEQIPEVIMPENIEYLQEKIEKITESIDETVKKLEETHLEEKAEEIENSAETIRKAADINQNLNQTGIWQTSHEIITTKIIAPDGTVFVEEAFFEKVREGKFGIEITTDVLSTEIPKPGIYTIENTITVNGNEFTINEEFAWGLVSLNTKKSTYYPGDTAEFEIVVLNSVGSPVCDANLVMSINGTILSSGADITPNADCGIYDATYDTDAEGTYHVNISAIADGIQTGFETTFDVANYVEFDIIRTAQSKIDPINNPNEFEVIIDITSHTDTNEIQILETVPSVFGITTDGQTSIEDGITTITWNKTLVGNSTQISYTYSVPLVFPELYPLGGIQINYDGKSYNEARPWFVANDPITISDNIVNLDEVISIQDEISVVTSTNQVVLNEIIELKDDITNGTESSVQLSTIKITKDSDGARQGFGMGMANLGDLNGDGVDDLAVGAAGSDKAYGNSGAWHWNNSRNGAVYIMYMNVDGSVKSTVTIDKDTANVPSSTETESYGRSIENLGDLDGDGVVDIAVGADWQDNAKGAVYIHYLNANGSVKSTVKINGDTTNGPSLTAGDYYGSDIANMGDLDGDGITDIAVGADEDSSAGTNKGAVYIHYLNANGSVKSTLKINENTDNVTIASDGGYGNSVENIGDLDGDGVNDLAVGETGKASYSASGYVHIHFMNADESIKSTHKITGSNSGHMPNDRTSNSYNHFGSAIVSLGDQDGDGVNDLAVGANLEGYSMNTDGDNESDQEMAKGGVYILNMKTDGTVKTSYRINEDTPNGPEIWGIKWGSSGYNTGQFGSSLAVAKINADYTMDLIVGSPSDGTVGAKEGAIWTIFYNGPTNYPVVELEESITLTDEMTVHPTVSLLESVSLTDVNSGTLGKAHIAVSESISFVDTSIVSGKDVTQWINETATLSGTVVPNFHIYYPSLTESISLTDAITGVLETDPLIRLVVEVTKDSDGARQGFGSGMTSLGDLDSNGAMDLAVGVTEADHLYTGGANYWNTGRNGAVYIVYMNTDGSIKSTVTIDKDTTNGPGSSATLGYGTEVENLGDLDGDGVVDIAVGSEAEESEKGVIYIHYLNSNGSVKSTVKINGDTTNGPSLTAGDNYGSDIANMGDMDGDGVIDIAVGADEDSSAGTDEGAVYIHYMNANGSIKSTVKINDATANGPTLSNNMKYGSSVENIGDLDGDEINDMVVGSPGTKSYHKGMVHIHFMNANGSIKSTVQVDGWNLPGDSTWNNWCACYIAFGTAIVNMGDQNNDGVTDIAVGASMFGYGADRDGNGSLDSRMDKGAVFILHMKADGSVDDSFIIDDKTPNGPAIWNSGNQWKGQFGSSLASADIDDDGKLDLVVGAPSDISAGEREGSIWTIFLQNGASYLKNYPISISESISFTDVAGKRSSIGLSESLTLTDSELASRGISISESISFTDTAIYHDLKIGNVESISFTDTITIEKDVTQFIDETVSLTDTAEGERVAIELSETLALTDSITITREFKVYSSTEINHNTSNAPDLTNRQGFGASVASLGDMDSDGVVDIAVGTQGLYGHWVSPWDYFGNNVNGAVYIMYLNSDGSVKSTVTIDKDTANGAGSTADHGYGQSIASLGDLDGDGVTDIAVGDIKEDSNKGRIFIHYLNANGSVKSTVEIKHGTTNGPSLAGNDFYGMSIANMGDLNDDGVIDIAVGAPGDDDAGSNTGGVYIHYMNTDGSMDSTVKLTYDTENGASLGSGSNIPGNFQYGYAVANIGDLDDDGINDMAVSEPRLESYSYTGPINIHFMNANGSIKSTVEIDGSALPDNLQRPASAYSHFGSSIVGIGDRNNDGVPDIAVGAKQDGWGVREGDNYRHEMGKGGVYILHMNSDGSVKENFRIGDATTNGPTTIYNDADGAFSTNNGGWSCCGDQFGSSMAHIGDLDGDNQSDLVVGAWQDNTVGNLGSSWDDKGAIWIIQYSGSKPADTTSKIKNLSESISFSDSVGKSAVTKLSESISFTDISSIGISISESISFSDTAVVGDYTVGLSESISFSDSISLGRDVTQTISESISFTDSATKQLDVSLSESLALSDITPSIPINIIATDAENLLNPEYVEIFTIGSSTYAIVTQPAEDKVTIYDVSDPTNIVVTDTETDGANGFTVLDGATGVDTFTIGASTYAIVTAGDDSGVQMIDVSDPTDIVAKDAETDGVNGFTRLSSPISGVETFTVGSITYAIVTDKHVTNGGVQIIDVSDPTDIVAVDAETDGVNGFTELQGAYASDIFTIGASTYAIVTAIGDWGETEGISKGVQIIDISDPANIVAKDEFTNANLVYPGGVDTFTIGTSTYAIVTGYIADTVQILDVSDPTDISAVDSLANSGSLELDGAFEVDVFTTGFSTYAIITGFVDDGIQIIDVSDPTDISAVDSLANSGSLELDGAIDVETFVIGTKTYAIIVSLNTWGGSDGGVQMLQLSSDDEFAKKSANVSISESILLTDSASANKDISNISLTESVSFTDSTSIGKTVTNSLTESVSFDDSISKETVISLTESVSFTDSTSIGKTVTNSLTESVSFDDSISKTVEIPLSESVLFTDTASKSKTIGISLSEELQLQTASQYNDITAVRAKILDNQYNLELSSHGTWSSLIHLHSDMYVLSKYSTAQYRSSITTLTISPDGGTITELDYLNHDSDTSGVSSIIKVDSDTVAVAYHDLSAGVISTFDIDSDGNITKVERFEHNDSGGYFNSLVQVDSDTFALASNDGYGTSYRIEISTFDIDSDGDITGVKTESQGNSLLVGYGWGYNSLVQVDSDTYALAYTGDWVDGYISTFTISSDGTEITEVDTLEHDDENAKYNSLVQVDSDTYALAYERSAGDGGGFISTFDIDSDGDITAVKTRSEGNYHKYVTYGATQSWGKSFVKMDSDTFALAHTSASVGGHITTFNISESGETITKLDNLHHDEDYATRGTLLKVDSDTVVAAYHGGGLYGIIATFTIGTGSDLISTNKNVNTSLSESIILTDNLVKSSISSVVLSESISLTDNTSKTAEIPLSESVLFTDTASKSKTIGISLSDELQLQTTSHSPPTDIIAVDAETDGVNGFDALDGATDVDIFTIGASTYAIVTGKFDNGVQMIDVSDPTNIVALDEEFDWYNGFDMLGGAHGVDTFTIGASTYAIVTGPNRENMPMMTDGIQVIDVSDPTNIVATDAMTEGRISDAYNVETFTIGSSTYAIVPSHRGQGVQMIDVSDPTNIVALDEEYNNNNGFDRLTRATDVAIFTIGSSTYAIVTAGSPLGHGVQIIDVSDPTNIVAKDSASYGTDMQTYRAHGVETFTIGASTYAIVTSQGSSTSGVQIIDVSDPTNIVGKDAANDMENEFEELLWAHDVDIFTNGASTYAIVTASADSGVQIIDISDPTDIVAVDAETDGVNGFTELQGARGVDTFTIGANTYAIVASQQDDGVQIIKLSTATATGDDAILVKKSINMSLSESLILTDNFDRSKAELVSLTEIISLTDSASETKDTAVPLMETVLLIEDIVIGKATTTHLTESVSLTDDVSKIVEKSLSESVSMDGIISKSSMTSVTIFESISLIANSSKGVERPLSESISLTAVTTVDGTTTIALSESISLTDNASYTKKIGASLSESISFVTSFVENKDTLILLTESAPLSDSISVIPIKLLSETIVLTDFIEVQYQPRIVETLTFTDTVEIQRSPLAPDLFAVPAEDIVTLAWNPQSDSRVAPITDYVIQHSTDEENWTTINDGYGSVRAYSVEPSYPGCPNAPMPCMENGVDSYFRVQAINNLGTSEWSTVQDAMPESDDNEYVREVVVTPQPEKFTVSWEPHPNYWMDIVDYLIYYANTPSGPWTLHDDGYNTLTTVTIDGISSFEPTFVKVQPVMESNNGCAADEEAGPGASQIAWTMPLKQTPRQIPTADIFTFPEDNSVSIEWEKPRSGGAEIWNYEIQKRMTMPGMPPPMWDTPEEVWVMADAFDWYEYEILGLMSDSNYQFQIRGVNEIGSGVWSNIIEVKTKEGDVHNFHKVADVWWGDDWIDNDVDGWIDEEDEQRFGPPGFEESFDYSAEGTHFGDDQYFGKAQDFGAGQTFGDNTEFYAGQTFDDDVNFSGKNIKFNGANFQRAETFGDGAAFEGTQSFTGQNTFGDLTEFKGEQNFGSAIQTFGDGVKFHGATDFADGQTFGANTEFADGQTFEATEDYDFEMPGLDFGAGTAFGRAEVFGRGAEFDNGAVDFYGTNTFGYGTKFAAGQDFDAPQIFGQGVDFEDNMEFADGQVFTLDFDFNEEGLEFGNNTVFCEGEEIGAGAEFKGKVELGGVTKFKGEEGKPIKFAAGQEFDDYIHDFIGEVEFMGEMEFKEGQDFEGDVEFKGLFDYDDMFGKALEFKGDVDFFMPPPVLIGDELYVPPLKIPADTKFGDEFDYEDMWSDDDGDGVNDEYYVFEPGVEFHADTRFPPMVEFADGFSKNDMLGKQFEFTEGVFFAGDPIFPSGQKIKPGVMWDEAPTFEAGVDMDPGLALPAGTKFSADLVLPAFVAAPYGLVLEPFTCPDEDCIPDADAYLEPGELLPPGVDPAPVVNFITGSNSTFANPGLGFEMAFESVAKDGKVKVDLQDPLKVPGTSTGDADGQRAMTSGKAIFQNVGSIIDVSIDTAQATGSMTVTLPYDESILGSASEDEIVLLHYTGGKWVKVDNITIDKENNKVSGVVDSLSPFTVGKQTGVVSTGSSSGGGAAGGGPAGGGGGGGAVFSEGGEKAGYPPLDIVEVTYDTEKNIVKVVLQPEYEKTDVIIKTATGFEIAKKVGTHPILNQAIYEAALLVDSGPLQVSATAFVKSVVIEANPLVTTVSAGTVTIKPGEESKPPVIITTPKEFQKPDEFIDDIQCPLGTELIDGKCVSQTFQEQPIPVQFAIILLLILLAIGLVLAVEIRRRKVRKVVSSQLLFETEEEVIRPPPIKEPEPPIITPQELDQEKYDLIELLQILKTEEAIQKKLHLLESQLLENVKEEAVIRERLTILVKLVEIRINLVEPLLPQQFKALPRPKRTYKKKRKVLTVEHKAKIASARRGKKQTEITKQKIVLSKTGRKMSDEHKAKIAAARRGKKQTEETKKKIAESRIGKKLSESTKQKISSSRKTKNKKEDYSDET